MVIMLDKDKSMGICKTCSKDLTNDAANGKFIGEEGYSNGYKYGSGYGTEYRTRSRRDSAIDLVDEMYRDGIDKVVKKQIYFEQRGERDFEFLSLFCCFQEVKIVLKNTYLFLS